MKPLFIFILIVLFNYSNAQTIDNFKIEHNPSSLFIKLHVVNTPGCKMDSLLTSFNTMNQSSIIELWPGQWTSPLTSGTIDSIIPNKHGENDTVMTIRFKIDPIYLDYPQIRIVYSINGNNYISLPDLVYTQFLKSNHYNPCFASVGPKNNIPTIYWESIENNMIKYYIIKRNGETIDTIQYATGIISYTDSTNLDAPSFIQTYSIEAIDSSNNHRSGSTTTLHARNLASVDGLIEMDWTIPITSSTINHFIIYEYKILDSLHDTLIVVHTLPSNITQYSVINPNVNSSYIVGTSNLNCAGTAEKSLYNNILLSNKLRVKGSTQTTSIETIFNEDKIDEVIGYFDTLGRQVELTNTKGLIITRYKSGKIEKKLY